MFSEILKIIPRLDNSELSKMEKSLSTRFGRVAKKFGKGMAASLLGGGIAGAALGIIEKILNPLKETQDAIDRTLQRGGDIVANAEQFGTTAGKLAKLYAFGAAKGLDQEGLNVLLTKYQATIAEAKADPTKQTSVRNFTGIPDTAESFFEFIQALRLMPKDKQILVQQEVFGEKQILKMADFLNSDLAALSKKMNLAPAESITPRLMNLDAYADIADEMGAKRGIDDLMNKSQLINRGMMQSRDAQLRAELTRENQKIGSYQSLMNIDMAATRVVSMIEKEGLGMLREAVSVIKNLAATAEKLPMLRALRGLGPVNKDK